MTQPDDEFRARLAASMERHKDLLTLLRDDPFAAAFATIRAAQEAIFGEDNIPVGGSGGTTKGDTDMTTDPWGFLLRAHGLLRGTAKRISWHGNRDHIAHDVRRPPPTHLLRDQPPPAKLAVHDRGGGAMSKLARRCAMCNVAAVDSVISPGDTYFPHQESCPLAARRDCPNCNHHHGTMTVREALACTLDVTLYEADDIVDVVLGHLEHEEEER